MDAWAWSPSKYIQGAVRNLERILELRELKLRAGVNSPLSNNYRPECDLSSECENEDARLYISLIGVLRWIVELGGVDIDKILI